MNNDGGLEPLPVFLVTVISMLVGLFVGGIPGAVIVPVIGLAVYAMTVSEVKEGGSE